MARWYDALAIAVLAVVALIAAVTFSGELLVKEGSLTAVWNHEHRDVHGVAVASDSTYGPLIAAVTSSGGLLVTEGSTGGGVDDEYRNPDRVAVASNE